MEIWDSEKYHQYHNENNENFEAVAEKLGGAN
jgi:DNA-binding transcriptional regulator/RsmH inhibitor MraZ